MHGNRKSHDPLAIRSARDRCTSLIAASVELAGDQTGMGVLLSYFARRFSPALFTFFLFFSPLSSVTSPLSLSFSLTSIHIPVVGIDGDDGDDGDDGTRCAQTTLNYLQTLKRGGKTEPTMLCCSGANVDDPAPFSVNVHSS